MSAGKRALIIGPGFIGWNVLDLLVAEGYSVTGFVRRKEHGDAIKASGAANVVLGDLNDKKLSSLHRRSSMISSFIPLRQTICLLSRQC
jgi:nucleoside-diphosphate-sugar epimerase